MRAYLKCGIIYAQILNTQQNHNQNMSSCPMKSWISKLQFILWNLFEILIQAQLEMARCNKYEYFIAKGKDLY